MIKASISLPNGKNSDISERRWYQEFPSTMIRQYPTTSVSPVPQQRPPFTTHLPKRSVDVAVQALTLKGMSIV